MSRVKDYKVGGIDYRVTVGGSNVKISREGFRTLAPFTFDVAGWSPDADDDEYPILPSHVCRWIRLNAWRFTLLKTEKPLQLRQPSIDDVLFYKGPNGAEGECGLKIWIVGGGNGSQMPHRYIVMMTELPDNKGISVTNAVEEVALEALTSHMMKADPDDIIWIEHYPFRGDSRSLRIPESFDLVNLKYDGKKFRLQQGGQPWVRVSEEKLKELGLVL